MSRRFLNGIDAALQKIVNLATGTNPNDAVNLAQLQAALAGLSWHGAVRAASTTNVTIASPGGSIDGVNLATGDRVLLKNQTTGSQNNVYIFNGASSPMSVAADGQQGYLSAGAAFYVDEGTTNADTAWTLATDNPITVGTTSLTFNKFGAGNAYTADNVTLNLTGTVFSVNTSKIPQKYATNVGDGSSTTITVTHNLGTLDVMTYLYDNTTGAKVDADEGAGRTTNAIPLTFGVAPGAGGLRCVIIG